MSRAVPLAAPLVACDGTRFEIDANLAVYERAAGLKQLSAAETRGAPSLRELCNCAFRLRGHQADAEARALTLAELATIVFGPERQPGETHALAAALAEMGLARAGADYLWTPRVGPRTRALDRTLLDAYGETKPRGRLAGAVRRHSVPMHPRQSNTDVSARRPSQEKRRLR